MWFWCDFDVILAGSRDIVDFRVKRSCTPPNIGVECSPRAESMWFWFVAKVRRAWKNAPYMPPKGIFSRSFHFCCCFSRILPRFWASKLSFASCSDFMGFRAFSKFENFSHCKHWKETHALGLRILFYIRTKRFWWIGTARSSHSMLWLGKLIKKRAHIRTKCSSARPRPEGPSKKELISDLSVVLRVRAQRGHQKKSSCAIWD